MKKPKNFKFRIYDIAQKKMNYLTGENIVNPVNSLTGPLSDNEDDIVCMPFIGIKDKTEKDVYEGDILFNEETYSYCIADENALINMEFRNPESGETFNYTFHNINFLIIGNILENKELVPKFKEADILGFSQERIMQLWHESNEKPPLNGDKVHTAIEDGDWRYPIKFFYSAYERRPKWRLT